MQYEIAEQSTFTFEFLIKNEKYSSNVFAN